MPFLSVFIKFNIILLYIQNFWSAEVPHSRYASGLRRPGDDGRRECCRICGLGQKKIRVESYEIRLRVPCTKIIITKVTHFPNIIRSSFRLLWFLPEKRGCVRTGGILYQVLVLGHPCSLLY